MKNSFKYIEYKEVAFEIVAELEEEVAQNQERIMRYENKIKILDEENDRNMKQISKIMKKLREKAREVEETE